MLSESRSRTVILGVASRSGPLLCDRSVWYWVSAIMARAPVIGAASESSGRPPGPACRRAVSGPVPALVSMKAVRSQLRELAAQILRGEQPARRKGPRSHARRPGTPIVSSPNF